VEYTCYKYCDMLFAFGAVIVEFVLIYGNSPCIILFNVIQALMHVDN